MSRRRRDRQRELQDIDRFCDSHFVKVKASHGYRGGFHTATVQWSLSDQLNEVDWITPFSTRRRKVPPTKQDDGKG